MRKYSKREDYNSKSENGLNRRPTKKEKDKFLPKVAFGLSLGFWVPLFNVGLCIASLILAIKSINNINRNPKANGGLGFVIAALVLSISSLVLTAIGLSIYLTSEQICESIICQQYYQEQV